MDIDIIVPVPATDDVDTSRKQKSIALSPHDVKLEKYPERDDHLFNSQRSSTVSSSIDEIAADLENLTPLAHTSSQRQRVSIDQFYRHHIPERLQRTVTTSSLDTIPAPGASTAAPHSTATTNTKTQSPRHTVDDLIQETATSPPSYISSLRSHSTIAITPRAEEGHETLPKYTCDLALSALFLRKSEFEGPLNRAPVRAWHRVHVTLQGTALTISLCPRISLPRSKPLPPPRTYSLQHAEVGIAADYSKRRYVIRLRVEADQLLLASDDAVTHVAWLEALAAAIDLAPALDERSLPVDVSHPRPRRQRARPRYVAAGSAAGRRAAAEDANTTAAAQTAAAVAATTPSVPASTSASTSDPITTAHAPSPEPTASIPASHSSSTSSLSAPTPSISTGTPPTATTTHAPTRSQPDPYSIYPAAMTRSKTTSSRRVANPNVTKEGKWRPVHNWSPLYDLIYAKRCMVALTSESPRKGPFVIMRGERWVVDWETDRKSVV